MIEIHLLWLWTKAQTVQTVQYDSRETGGCVGVSERGFYFMTDLKPERWDERSNYCFRLLKQAVEVIKVIISYSTCIQHKYCMTVLLNIQDLPIWLPRVHQPGQDVRLSRVDALMKRWTSLLWTLNFLNIVWSWNFWGSIWAADTCHGMFFVSWRDGVWAVKMKCARLPLLWFSYSTFGIPEYRAWVHDGVPFQMQCGNGWQMTIDWNQRVSTVNCSISVSSPDRCQCCSHANLWIEWKFLFMGIQILRGNKGTKWKRYFQPCWKSQFYSTVLYCPFGKGYWLVGNESNFSICWHHPWKISSDSILWSFELSRFIIILERCSKKRHARSMMGLIGSLLLHQGLYLITLIIEPFCHPYCPLAAQQFGFPRYLKIYLGPITWLHQAENFELD